MAIPFCHSTFTRITHFHCHAHLDRDDVKWTLKCTTWEQLCSVNIHSFRSTVTICSKYLLTTYPSLSFISYVISASARACGGVSHNLRKYVGVKFDSKSQQFKWSSFVCFVLLHVLSTMIHSTGTPARSLIIVWAYEFRYQNLIMNDCRDIKRLMFVVYN